MKTFQELIECLEQASNQIENKDNKIKELLNLIQNKEEKNKENNIKENIINKLNEEKNILIKKKYEYDNRIIGMTKLINKLKEELDKKNIEYINKENNLQKILEENNILNKKIIENEKNIKIKHKKEIEDIINKMNQEFNNKYNILKKNMK